MNGIASGLQLRVIISKMPTERRRRARWASYFSMAPILLGMARRSCRQCRATCESRVAYVRETLIEIRFSEQHGGLIVAELIGHSGVGQVPWIRSVGVGQIGEIPFGSV